MKSITYAFRRPRFPVICAIDGDLIGVQSPASLQRCLAALDLSGEKELRLEKEDRLVFGFVTSDETAKRNIA